MAELESLSFRVESSQLTEAASKIAALTAAIVALSASQLSAAEAGKQTAKAERQAAKDASALLILKQKLADAEAKAAAATNGTTQANDKVASKAASLASLLDRLNNAYLELAKGQTRGEASTLQLARTLGASADQINQVRASLQNIAGLTSNPFDASRGSLIRIQSELDGIKERARLAGESIYLSGTQLAEYAKISNQVKGQVTGLGLDPLQGAGLALYNTELEKQRKEYVRIAEEVNRKTAAEKVHNDTLKAQATIMAELEQKNKNIQESISRNQSITASMQTGASQTQAGTNYDNSRLIAGAATPEQLARIQERITLTQKLTESEKLLNIEVKAQDDLLKHIEGIVAQRKAIDDLNKSVIANVAERKKMDDLMTKYTGMGLNNTNASEVSKLEFKGASQASIDSLKTYLLGVQQVTKAKEDQKKIDDDINAANQRAAMEAAATRYSGLGHSSTISNTAAGMEVKGVPAAAIQSYIQDATAKEQSNKATRELTAAKKYLIETEERLAAAVNNANQNLNRQSTDELVKYQRALATVGTSTDDTTRKMAALKAQLDLVAGKERQNQLNHLSRAISTQMGDVGISLASGMNPLTVMLQQGDQIRFALQQAGAEGAELQKAMSGAASQIASSVALTFRALSGFVVGTFATMGKAILTPFTAWETRVTSINNANMLLRAGFIDTTRHARLLDVANLTALKSLGGLASVVTGVAVVALATLAIAFFQVIKQEQALSKAIVESGASMGYSKDSAVAFASSLEGITTNTAISALTDFANAGVRGSATTEKMMLAAIDLEKYGGKAVEETAKAYAALQGEPMKALQELAEASGRVTVATLDKAKAYKDAGDKAGLLELAESEVARVTEEKAQAMKASMSPISMLWIDIKHAIAGVWEEIQNLVKAGPVVNTLGAYFKTLAILATEIKYAFLQVGSAIGGIGALGVAAMSDIKNLDVGFTETKRMHGILEESHDAINNNRIAAISSILDIGNASASASKQSAEQMKLNTEAARSFDFAAKEQEKNITKVNKLLAERRTLMQEMDKAKGQGAGSDATVIRFISALKDLDKKIKEAKEAEFKKDHPKAKRGETASFSSPTSNLQNIEKEYNSALALDEKYNRDKREIIKLQFEAGVIERGKYIAEDIKLVVEGEKRKLADIEKYSKLINDEYKKDTGEITKAKNYALSLTRDPKSISHINKAASDHQKKLDEANITFNTLQEDKKQGVGFDTNKRFYESLKEQNTATLESKKHLDELNKSMSDASEIRKLDAEYQIAVISLSGSEVAMYKAKNDVLQNYIKIKSKIQGDLDKAEKTHIEFTDNMQYDGESQQKALQLWMQVQALKDQVTKAGIASELEARNAATDAFNKYYMDKAMEVRDGTANAITEGIMNGGQAGSKAIKSVLDNILKDLLNNVFKKILGSVGDMILQSIMQAQVASSASSSGGGFLQTLVSAGLSAFAGGMGGTTAGATSQYSLASGSTDMTSGFKMRAVGGFVNQGSEYMVGENGPEKFIPKQTGSIVPNHDLAKSNSSEPLKLTIINNTSAPIGRVTERQISPTERALVIEDAVNAVASALYDPNHKVSKSFGNNFASQRKR